MEVRADLDGFHLFLSADELRRLCVALAEGCSVTSPAEYFIRTGLSQSGVRHVVDELWAVVGGGRQELSVALDAGIEAVENPRRPRPPRRPADQPGPQG